jgi:hypothetical protein
MDQKRTFRITKKVTFTVSAITATTAGTQKTIQVMTGTLEFGRRINHVRLVIQRSVNKH